MKTIKGNATRPTSDRVKESLFNIISGYVYDSEVLDLFAGTGNLGIEALSRGARNAVFIDKSPECGTVIKENLMHTRLDDRATIITAEIETALSRLSKESRKFDIVFLDPPYNKNLIEETLKSVLKNDIIKPDTIVVAEKDIDDAVPEEIGNLKLTREQKYGDTILSFYKVM